MNVHRVRSAGEPAFEGLVRVYTQAHPASERKSLDALRRMMGRPEYLFLTVEDAEKVVGFAIAIALADWEAVLLEYMAVDADRRGKGIGGLLFRAIAGWPEARDRFLLMEVDSDRPGSADARDCSRRKAFYRRLGCREIEGLTYAMPRVSGDEPPRMDMLVYRSEMPERVDKARVRGWLEALYAQVYGQTLPDARIDEMAESLPEAIRLV